MYRKIIISLLLFTWIQSPLSSLSVESNLSYDYFRTPADGSWNGNNGLLWNANLGLCLWEGIAGQIGGSYGLYNWDGRQNLVFSDPQQLQQQGFITLGLSTSLYGFAAGLVYDRIFTNYFGIYGVSPTFDQLRFQIGYLFHSDEVGIWGTGPLVNAHENVLGIPLKFRAIGQVNLFWTHYFMSGGSSTLWAGVPYQRSLQYTKEQAGTFVAGFTLKAPLTSRFQLEGTGSYMKAPARNGGISEARNYCANITVGITYSFSNAFDYPYLPVANHSNFLIDTNINQ